jgi:hypothetical protein
MALKLFNFLITSRLVIGEKYDKIFPLKLSYGYINNSIQKINVFNKNKTYDKILVKYIISSLVYSYIYTNTSLKQLQQTSIKDIPFKHLYNKPIVNISIKFKKNEKKHNISYIIPLLKEFHPNSNINDILLFYVYHINEKTALSNYPYHKIYIKTLMKKKYFKYTDLDNINITQFYKLLN